MKTIELHPLLRALFCVVFITTLALYPAQPAHAAAYTVNSLADTNDGTCDATNCTLREAINAANATHTIDTISFSQSGTITLGSILPGIAEDKYLTIDGTGRSIHLNGNDHDRILWTDDDAKLTLKHLTFEHGYTVVSGGAIYSEGPLTIDGCTFDHNVADDFGGAIYSMSTLTITSSTLTYNYANNGSGGALYVYTNTIATVNGSVFQWNYAIVSGGAIYSIGRLKAQGSNFFINRADFGDGGAIYQKSPFATEYLTLDQTVFSLNHAGGNGGGLYIYSGDFYISNASFAYNDANKGGGGMYLRNDSPFSKISDSSFKNNIALEDGGGFFTLYGDDFYFNRVLFQNNHADEDGGAIYNFGGHAFVYRSTFDSNTADLNGGGLYNRGLMSIQYDTFEDNHALQNGGAIYQADAADTSGISNSTFYDNNADKGGGAYGEGSIVFHNCTLSTNSATTTGGAIYAGYDTGFYNSILANSTSGGNCDNEGTKPRDMGNNIDSAATCGWDSTYGSLKNTNPLLGPLKLDGGDTETMAPQAGSPAVDGVIYNAPNDCPENDQRGYPRPFGARCDIGAFERYYRLFMPQVIKH
jgi:CSLREA domain-containing protein